MNKPTAPTPAKKAADPNSSIFVPYLEAGSSRTLFSASVANQLIYAINRLLNMQGVNGIEIKRSEANITIGFTGKMPAGGGGTPGDGEGTWLSFGGDWDPAEDYAVGTIVKVDQADDLASGIIAGDYVALTDNLHGTPKPGTPGAEEFWELFSRGNWSLLVLSQIEAPAKAIEFDADGGIGGMDGLPGITLVADRMNPSSTQCLIRLTDIAGQIAKFREVTACVGGVAKRMKILATEPY